MRGIYLLSALIVVGHFVVGNKTCRIEGCEGKSRSRGMCERHFNMNWSEPTDFVNDPRVPFHWLILCYIERYFAYHRKYPTNRHMMRFFNQRRAGDIWDRVQVLIKRGYLKRDPSYRRGQTRAAIMLTGKRFDCSMLVDIPRLEEFDRQNYPSVIDTKRKKREEESDGKIYQLF